MRNQKIIFVCQILALSFVAMCMFFFPDSSVLKIISYLLFGLLAYWCYSSLLYTFTLKSEVERNEYERAFFKAENDRMWDRVSRLNRQLQNQSQFHKDLKTGYDQQHAEIVSLSDQASKLHDINKELADANLKQHSDICNLIDYCHKLEKYIPAYSLHLLAKPVLNFVYTWKKSENDEQ